MIITINMKDGTSVEDVNIPGVVYTKNMVAWISEKYGIKQVDVTMKDVLMHIGVMACISSDDVLSFKDMNSPEYTSGDVYDEKREAISSVVVIETSK